MAVSKCRDCGEEVVWMETLKGKKIAVDIETCNQDDTLYNREVHKCHFETCTQRKERPAGVPSNGGYLEAKIDMIQADVKAILAIIERVAKK